MSVAGIIILLYYEKAAMKKTRFVIALAMGLAFYGISCMHDGAGTGEPVVTTPSAPSSSNSTAGPAASNSTVLADTGQSVFQGDSTRTDTLR